MPTIPGSSAPVPQARALRLVHDGEIEAALARAGNRRGVARMRAFLRGETESGYTLLGRGA